MKIQHLTIQNLLGLRQFAVQLSPLALVAGPNGVGKSTIKDALKLALSGDLCRVHLKGDAAKLVTDAGKTGSVTVVADQFTVGISIPTLKRTIEGEVLAELEDIPGSLDYVLDPSKFPALPNKERRQALFKITGVKLDSASVCHRMTDRGIGNAEIQVIKPLLRSGFDTAHTEAQSRARDARATWKSITKEPYGTQKAEDWQADKPEFDPASLQEASRQYESITTTIGDLQRELAGAYAEQKSRQNASTKASELKDKADTVGKHSARLGQAEEEYKAYLSEVEKAQAKVDEIMANVTPTTYPCPCCEVALVWNKGHLEEFKGDTSRYSAGDLTQAKNTLEDRKKALESLKRGVSSRKRDKEDAVAAAKALQQLGHIANPEELQKDIDILKTDIADMTKTQREAHKEIERWKAIERAAGDADEKTSAASGYHQQVLTWLRVAEALAPDGIPSEILVEALGPFNERLRESSIITGWKQVAVGSDMEITYGGRLYGLCSESEKWRADAMIGEAISHLSGLKLLVLDRMDVLDFPARGQCLKWLFGLSKKEQIDTCILMSTVKERPKLPDGIQVIWMGAESREREAA